MVQNILSRSLLFVSLIAPHMIAVPLVQADDQTIKIGVSVSDLGNPYFRELARSIQIEADARTAGETSVKVVSSAYDLMRQRGQLIRFASDGYQLVMLSAASFEGLTEAMAEIQQSGVHVVAVDVAAQGADATVTTDNYLAGIIACESLAQSLDYKGKVALLNGPQVSSVIERVDGCLNVLSNYDEIEVLSTDQNGGGSFEGGFERMTYLLTAYPELDGVFAINDPSALGGEQAALASGNTELVITSVDGAPQARERINHPQTLIKATAAQFPSRIAAKAVELGLAMVSGSEPEKAVWLIEPELVTKENNRELESW